MSEAVNVVCLVCDEPLEAEDENVTVVKSLNYHEECLGYIPEPTHFDRVRQNDGHAVRDRMGNEVDMSVLLGSQANMSQNGPHANDK